MRFQCARRAVPVFDAILEPLLKLEFVISQPPCRAIDSMEFAVLVIFSHDLIAVLVAD